MSVEVNANKRDRERWLERTLAGLPEDSRILDAGAGELQYRRFCEHLEYLSQDFCQYDGEGSGEALQTGGWDTSKVDIVCDITHIPEPDDFAIDELSHNGNYFDYLRQEIKRVKRVAREYAELGLLDKLKLNIIGGLLRGQLKKFSLADRGSSELLSFGIHLLATKQ